LLKVFTPAFLGRLIVIPYYPIVDEAMRQIIQLQLDRIGNRLQENNRAVFSYDDALVTEVARRCTEVESGARNVDHILTRTLLPEISQEFLARMAFGKAITKVHVSVHSECGFLYEVA
jgi:type VI secretion system protein VasG